MKTDVSVIIPVYNGEKFISRAINSVLRQSLTPTEIIVVNDGSTDATLKALTSFGDKVIIISTENSGVSEARNTGFAASTCGLIAFLDADDEWHDEKLQRQVEFLHSQPGAGLCCCDYVLDDGDGNRRKSQFRGAKRRQGGSIDIWSADPLTALIKGNFIGTTSTVLVKRSILDAIGLFNPRYKQAEDYDLWIRCALVTEFAILPETLLRKIGHANNLTNNHLETLRYHEIVLNEHAAGFAIGKKVDAHAKVTLALAETRYEMANRLVQARQYAESMQYYAKAIKTQKSARNFALFFYYASRKIARIASFGLLRSRDG